MIDQAVEEIRKRRRELLRKRCGGSIDRLLESCRQWQRENPGRTVSLKRRHHTRAVA